MANYNDIIDLYLQGKAPATIVNTLKLPPSQVRFAIQEFNISNKETIEDRLLQIRTIEAELFAKMDEEKQSGKKSKIVDELILTYKNYTV